MAHTSCLLLLLLNVLGSVTFGLACYCESYPWAPWSPCTRTCNYGTQQRSRNIIYDDYYWKNSCNQLCKSQDTKACNEQACPIHCRLSDFGPWSECSACARKQLRTRSIQTPSQFGGVACSMELTEERPCYPSTECRMAPIDCKDDFQCDNGRCINSTLTCNKQNDCGDGTDERNCVNFKVVCPVEKRVTPGADLVGNGFDAMAEEPRGAVLDNMFMGGICDIKRPKSTQLYHRIPHNFEIFEIKVGTLEDFVVEPPPVRSQTVELNSGSSSSGGAPDKGSSAFFLIFYTADSNTNNIHTNEEVYKASTKMDSQFFRVDQVLPVSSYKLRAPGDLVLSGPFLQFLHALPLEYNYGLYRDIFQRFGTHYYSSGTLGGHYDLLYQYSKEVLNSSAETTEHTEDCLKRDSVFTVILYTETSSVTRCSNNKMTEKYQGSYIQAAEKSFSMVRGGRAREAAALAWERSGPTPDRDSYRNWVRSVIENPVPVEHELLPIIDLVKGIPCAVTKRRHLRKALMQYLEEFDSCKCAPCPNNGRAALSGTECKCLCQPGTFGSTCERRAEDFTSEAVDGYWSCWAPWSGCRATMKRSRTRRCDNPAPLRGGRGCQGAAREDEICDFTLFQRQDTCDNDDDFTMGWKDELPPGVEGCLRPQRPENSDLTKAKLYYDFGEDEEFQCFTGFEMEGFPFINCLPGGAWTQPRGRCTRRKCFPPEVPDGMTLFPDMEEYSVGRSVGLNCVERGLAPLPRGFYTCTSSLTWAPPLPANLRCTDETPFVPESRCGPGQSQVGSKCVCVQRESCLSYEDTLCVLNVDLDVAVSMSICSFHAGRCHGDPLVFINDGLCDETDAAKITWAKFRASVSSGSSVQEPCGLDTCYEWETCSASQGCQCKPARECPKTGGHKVCVMVTQLKRMQTLSVCSMAALVCANYALTSVSEGACETK